MDRDTDEYIDDEDSLSTMNPSSHQRHEQHQAREDQPTALEDHAVRQALDSLYINVDLARSSLARRLIPGDSGMSIIQKAQTLRNILLDAIETLRPLNPSSPQVTTVKRNYDVLYLRYVSGISITEIAERLSLGERQIYRDLRQAERNLTEVLQARLPLSYSKSDSTLDSPVDQEDVSHLLTQREPVELAELVKSALKTVHFLADRQGVTLHAQASQIPLWVTIPASALRQLLVQLLSAIVQQGGQKQLIVKLKTREESAEVRIQTASSQAIEYTQLLEDALQMVDTLGFNYGFTEAEDGMRSVWISMPLNQLLPVLVVEDNAGVCELYRRYLQGTEWQPVVIDNLQQAEQMALMLNPCAVILDILMPDIDGWSVLQTFKMEPNLSKIPVVVCSVVGDPELATALGAAALLKKPLSRLELIGTLKQVVQASNG